MPTLPTNNLILANLLSSSNYGTTVVFKARIPLVYLGHVT